MTNFLQILLYKIDWTAIGTIIIAVGTFIVAYIAWTQLGKTNKISNADFIHRFKSDFFNEKTRQLFMLFDYDLIVFKTEPVSTGIEEFAYFEVNQKQFDANPIFLRVLTEKKYLYSVYEIDDLLLGNFEDLGLFCKRGLMDIEFIYEGFGYYIEEIYENQQIKNYMCWIKKNRKAKGKEADEDIYDNFDFIFNEVKCYENQKKSTSKTKSFVCNK